MSPFEVHALRCVGDGSSHAIKPDHRDLLIRMRLAKVNGSGELELTEDGRRRLAVETSSVTSGAR
jgi:ribosomal protein L30/L7E